jgi:phosphatidylglycerophosphatase A
MKNFMIKLFATGLGSGYLPVAPGTYGTVVAIPLYWLLKDLKPMSYLAFTVIFTLFACWVSHLAGPLLGETDSPHIVIDEIAGFLFTMFLLPATWQGILAGFIVFRILDSTKPWPIRWFEDNIPGGTGVVLDDVAAGIIGNIILLTAIHFWK